MIVIHDGRVIAANGPEVRAIDVRGNELWRRQLSGDVIGLRQWGDELIAVDAKQLLLMNPATGGVRLSVDAARAEEVASRQNNPGNVTVQIYGGTLSVEHAFLHLGTATIAIDRTGRRLWRNPRPAARDGRPSTSGNPLVADGRWLVTRDAIGSTVEVGLYEVGTGKHLWSVHYDHSPRPDPRRPKPPEPNPDAPSFGREWQSEGRIAGAHAALRDDRDVLVLRLSDGGTAWRASSPGPVDAIELMGDQLLVSAERVTAYTIGTGAQAWQVDQRHARLAVAAGGRSLVVASEEGISALDGTGRLRWSAPWPDSVRHAEPDRITAKDDIAFVTFRPPRGRPERLDVDVIAVALGTPG